jgi:hypothetical protein
VRKIGPCVFVMASIIEPLGERGTCGARSPPSYQVSKLTGDVKCIGGATWASPFHNNPFRTVVVKVGRFFVKLAHSSGSALGASSS